MRNFSSPEEYEASEDFRFETKISELLNKYYNDCHDDLWHNLEKYIECINKGIYPVYRHCEIEMEIFSNRPDCDFEKTCRTHKRELSTYIFDGGSHMMYDIICSKIKFFKDARFNFKGCKIEYVDF